MTNIVVAIEFNFFVVRPKNFLEKIFIMLQVSFRTIQSEFNVTLLEHRSFARSGGFSTVEGEVPHRWFSAQKFMKFVICNFFNIIKCVKFYIIKKIIPQCCKAHIHLSNCTRDSISSRMVTE